jgi:hypothetical protein
MPGITDPDYLAWKAQQTRNNLQSRNQFRGIEEIEKGISLGWQPIDNPPFTWPAKQYTDITGNQIQVQRGYMRSLVTDPRWAANSAAKNRKLFFQFNPTVLVRSVQQTVGTMNPLLQDPAQLTMPVPGTSTFGFELLFNREKEVASGTSYAVGQQPSFEDRLVLPNGDAVLPSQVGVLADIMVLDTITGQGISQDMVDILTAKSLQDAESAIQSREERLAALGKEEGNATEVAVEEAALEDLRKIADRNELTKLYNENMGNQAFLNPLPFRVLFSSLFMIEGVATSIEVQYQKFSATMIPTQCKVIINMYALYIGFGKQDTFLTRNLQQSFADTQATTNAETNTKTTVDLNIRQITVESVRFNETQLSNDRGVLLDKTSTTITDVVADKLKKKEINDMKMNIYIRYALFPSNTSVASYDSLINEAQFFNSENNSPDFKHPFAVTRVMSFEGGARCPDLNQKLLEEVQKPFPQQYLSYQLKFVFVTDGVESSPIYFPIVNGVQWSGQNTPSQTWTNSKSTRLTPRSGLQ